MKNLLLIALLAIIALSNGALTTLVVNYFSLDCKGDIQSATLTEWADKTCEKTSAASSSQAACVDGTDGYTNNAFSSADCSGTGFAIAKATPGACVAQPGPMYFFPYNSTVNTCAGPFPSEVTGNVLTYYSDDACTTVFKKVTSYYYFAPAPPAPPANPCTAELGADFKPTGKYQIRVCVDGKQMADIYDDKECTMKSGTTDLSKCQPLGASAFYLPPACTPPPPPPAPEVPPATTAAPTTAAPTTAAPTTAAPTTAGPTPTTAAPTTSDPVPTTSDPVPPPSGSATFVASLALLLVAVLLF
jgi:hypothetical protein